MIEKPNQIHDTTIVNGDGKETFVINSSGTVSVAQNTLHYSTKNEYWLEVRVEYGNSELVNVTINVSIIHVNKPPEWTPSTIQITKYKTPGAVIGNLNDFSQDPDDDELRFFILEGEVPYFQLYPITGIIQVAMELDFEDPLVQFFFDILIVDNGNPPLNTTGQLTVSVIKFGESSFVDSDKVLTVEENSAIGTNVGNPLVAYDSVRIIFMGGLGPSTF